MKNSYQLYKEILELRYEQEHTASLADLHKGSHEPELLLVDEINRKTYEHRAEIIHKLETELNSELYELHFQGASITEGTIPMASLAAILSKLQRVANAFLQDTKDKYKEERNLTKLKKENSPMLNVFAFEPGSFTIYLAGSDPDNGLFNGDESVRKDNVIYRSSERLFTTIQSGDDKEQLYDQLGKLSEAAGASIRTFYDELRKQKITVSAKWLNNSSTAPVTVTPAIATSASALIRRYPWKDEPSRTLTGHILGYSEKSKTISFAPQQGKSETIYYLEDMASQLADLHITMYDDSLYRVTLTKEAIPEGRSRAGRPAWFLTDITKDK